MRKKLLRMFILIIVIAIIGTSSGVAATKNDKTLNIALNGEPNTLRYQGSTSNLQGMVSKHIYENLVAFDSKNVPQPMLAKDIEISENKKDYIFNLREDIKFHNGEIMKAEDVVASIKRWLEISPRGNVVSSHIQEVSKSNEFAVKIKLKDPFSPLLVYLARDNAGAGIMPKEQAEALSKDVPNEYIGTGPYKFNEWQSGHYISLIRYEDYKSRTEESSLDAGRKHQYFKELKFYFVQDISTRIAGTISGEYDIAVNIDLDSYDRVENNPDIKPVISEFRAPMFFFNHKNGLMSDQTMRRAFLAALDMEKIMYGALGNEKFYTLSPSYYPEESIYYSSKGKEFYNQKNPELAKTLLEKSSYNGEPIRWLTSTEYDLIYNTTIVAVQQLNEAGFNIDLQVYDWATLLDKRSQDDAWDVFTTYHGYVPSPALLNTLNPNYPGWWNSPERGKLWGEYINTVDIEDRAKIWEKLQELHWEDVVVARTGGAKGMFVVREDIQNYQARPQPQLWNVWIDE